MGVTPISADLRSHGHFFQGGGKPLPYYTRPSGADSCIVGAALCGRPGHCDFELLEPLSRMLPFAGRIQGSDRLRIQLQFNGPQQFTYLLDRGGAGDRSRHSWSSHNPG